MTSIPFGTWLGLLASLAAAAPWEAPPTPAAGSVCGAALRADAEAAPGLGLLQSIAGAREARRREAKSLQTPASPKLPPVNAVNRTLYSTDPRASVDFFLRYFYGARSVSAESFGPLGSAGCLEVAAVELSYNGQTMGMLFLKEQVKSEGLAHLDSFAQVSDAEWENVMSRQQNYSPWVDFHDGFPSRLLNVQQLAKDGVRFQVYNRGYVHRLNVPHTAWTVELVATDETPATGPLVAPEDTRYLHDQSYVDPDSCRKLIDVDTNRLWWKATFAAADPLAAASFAIAVLGAHRIETPYPWPRQPNCTAALWVKLPSADGYTGMELHFVDSSQYPPGNLTVQQFNQYQKRFPSLRSERFARYLYNSLVLLADDLDPFVLKMQALGAPFLALRLAPESFALVFSFPRNDAIAVQIQSSRLAAVEAVDFEPCRAE